jgi:hypothetical protein
MVTKSSLIISILLLIFFIACTPISQVELGANDTPGSGQIQSDHGERSETPMGTIDAGRVEQEKPQSSQDIVGICLRYSDDVRLFISDLEGYCLRYPAEYDVSTFSPNGVMFFKYSTLNASDPNLQIYVQTAGGMTVEQAADQVAETYAMPGEEPQRVEMALDGETAIALLNLSGQYPNRRVVVVHQDYLYTLVFVEMDKNQPEIAAQAENLYNTVIQSFNFHPEGNLCPDCLEDGGEAANQNTTISSWLQHDLCQSGRDGEPQLGKNLSGGVKNDSPLGPSHPGGVLALTEPVI